MDDSTPRLRILSVQKGASGTATVAVGGSSFLVSLELVDEMGLPPSVLVPGSELDDAGLEVLATAAEAREAEKRGLALVARAEQSTFMLRAKLEARGFSRKAINITLDRLHARNFLNDRRFAEAYAASRLARRSSKAEGPASLIAALRARGVDRTTAAEAVAELLGPEERARALGTAAERALRRSSGDKDEARRCLRELGFKSEEISDFFDSDNRIAR
jgi:regulatory protein